MLALLPEKPSRLFTHPQPFFLLTLSFFFSTVLNDRREREREEANLSIRLKALNHETRFAALPLSLSLYLSLSLSSLSLAGISLSEQSEKETAGKIIKSTLRLSLSLSL